MLIKKLAYLSVVLALLAVANIACTKQAPVSLEESRRIAEEFVRAEATFQFDGMEDTFKLTDTATVEKGWKFTIQYESRHAGYGDRSGQAVAEVITPHTAEVTVQDGAVTEAIMDGQWDMIKQRIDMEIKLAPIEEVRVNILKSNPPQIGVYIKGGLTDGCTTFHDIEVKREGTTVDIKVTVQRPRGAVCTAVYSFFEKDVNLGSDFAFGTKYTLNVNDYSTTFDGTLIKSEGFAIYLTGDNVPPDRMEVLSHVEIADQPVISMRDIISYDAQTHEIRLTDGAFERISRLEVPMEGKSFLVCIDKAPTYWGAFWSPVSSRSFDGVTIWMPLGGGEPKSIKIELGYPGPSFYEGEDPRNSPEVMRALEGAGKLINKAPATSGEMLPRSFKGYELYSWEEGGEWHFSLISGTNRIKSVEEITSSGEVITASGWVKIRVTGEEAIKGVLSRLQRNEQVCWCDELHTGQIDGTDFRLPPAATVDAIKKQAEQCGLELMVAVW